MTVQELPTALRNLSIPVTARLRPNKTNGLYVIFPNGVRLVNAGELHEIELGEPHNSCRRRRTSAPTPLSVAVIQPPSLWCTGTCPDRTNYVAWGY